MRRSRTALWLLPILACSAGCWQPRYFAPRENVNGTGPGGHSAAVYRVARSGDTDLDGELRLWSEGARARYAENDEEVVELHLGFELENTGERPFEIDLETLRLEEVFVDGVLQDPLPPATIDGSGYIGPGGTSRLDLLFRPGTTYPRSVDGFALRFEVYDEAGDIFEEVTPFGVAANRQRGQFVNPGWGYGWGWGWGGFAPRFGRGFGPGFGWGAGCR